MTLGETYNNVGVTLANLAEDSETLTYQQNHNQQSGCHQEFPDLFLKVTSAGFEKHCGAMDSRLEKVKFPAQKAYLPKPFSFDPLKAKVFRIRAKHLLMKSSDRLQSFGPGPDNSPCRKSHVSFVSLTCAHGRATWTRLRQAGRSPPSSQSVSSTFVDVTVPRLESGAVTGEVITGLGSFFRQVLGMNASAVKLRYHLKGTAFAESPGDFTIPFDESGEVDLTFRPAAQE